VAQCGLAAAVILFAASAAILFFTPRYTRPVPVSISSPLATTPTLASSAR
jgi:hypothetical protein